MIKKATRITTFLLLFCIFFGFNFSTIDAFFSVEKIEAKIFCTTKTRSIEPGKASAPVCGFSITLLAGVATALIAALVSWSAGRALALIQPGMFPGSSALHKLGKMMMKLAKKSIKMALRLFIADTLGLMCLLTWVRYPVKRDTKGGYLKCTNPRDVVVGEGEEGTIDAGCPDMVYGPDTEYHWPQNVSDTSNFIEVCNDQYFPVMIGIFSVFTQWISGSLFDVTEDVWWADDLYGSDSSAFQGVKFIKAFLSLPGTRNCKVFKYNEQKPETGWVNGSYYKIKEAAGSTLCAYITDPVISLIEMETGCVLLDPAPPKPLCSSSKEITDSNGVIVAWDDSPCASCFISLSCFNPNNGVKVHANTPILTSAISCLQGTLVSMIAGNDRCNADMNGEYSGNAVFVNVLDKLKNGIELVILLSIILFGYRVYLGMIQGQTQYLMFLVKVAIVLYLTIGYGMIQVYEYLLTLSSAFGDIVIDAASSLHNGMCGFEDTEPAWLAVWDKLDCRIAMYLGLSMDTNIGVPIIGQVLLLPFTLLLDIFTGNFGILIALPIGLLSMVYGVIMLLFIFWAMGMYVISLIAMTVMVIISPIFLLMWLYPYFEATFTNWYKQVFGYAVYPILILSFISLTFVVVDAFFFGNLILIEKTTQVSTGTRDWSTGEVIVRDVHNYVLENNQQCQGEDVALACFFTYNINYRMKNLFFGTEVTTSSLKYEIFGFSDFDNAFAKFFQIGFVLFIFYHFSSVIGTLSAELLGSFRADLSGGSSPKESMQKVAAIAGYAATSGIEKFRTRNKKAEETNDKKDDSKKNTENSANESNSTSEGGGGNSNSTNEGGKTETSSGNNSNTTSEGSSETNSRNENSNETTGRSGLGGSETSTNDNNNDSTSNINSSRDSPDHANSPIPNETPRKDILPKEENTSNNTANSPTQSTLRDDITEKNSTDNSKDD